MGRVLGGVDGCHEQVCRAADVKLTLLLAVDPHDDPEVRQEVLDAQLGKCKHCEPLQAANDDDQMMMMMTSSSETAIQHHHQETVNHNIIIRKQSTAESLAKSYSKFKSVCQT